METRVVTEEELRKLDEWVRYNWNDADKDFFYSTIMALNAGTIDKDSEQVERLREVVARNYEEYANNFVTEVERQEKVINDSNSRISELEEKLANNDNYLIEAYPAMIMDADLENRINDINEKLGKANERKEEILREKEELEDEKKRVKEDLETIEIELNDLRRKIVSVKTTEEYDILANNYRELLSKKDELQKTLDSYETGNIKKEIEARLVELETEINEIEKQKNKLEELRIKKEEKLENPVYNENQRRLDEDELARLYSAKEAAENWITNNGNDDYSVIFDRFVGSTKEKDSNPIPDPEPTQVPVTKDKNDLDRYLEMLDKYKTLLAEYKTRLEEFKEIEARYEAGEIADYELVERNYNEIMDIYNEVLDEYNKVNNYYNELRATMEIELVEEKSTEELEEELRRLEAEYDNLYYESVHRGNGEVPYDVSELEERINAIKEELDRRKEPAEIDLEAPEKPEEPELVPIKEKEDETEKPKRREVVKQTAWEWIKAHKKQILIALGITALAISLVVLVTQLLPAIMAAQQTSTVAGLCGALQTNGAAWAAASAGEQVALHGANTALASQISALTGAATTFTEATGVWTIGGQSLAAASSAATAAAAKAAGTVTALKAGTLIAGLGGLGSLGAGLLLPKRSKLYKEINKKIKDLKSNFEDMSQEEFKATAEEIENNILYSKESELSDDEIKVLLRKLNSVLRKAAKKYGRNQVQQHGEDVPVEEDEVTNSSEDNVNNDEYDEEMVNDAVDINDLEEYDEGLTTDAAEITDLEEFDENKEDENLDFFELYDEVYEEKKGRTK